MQVGAPGTRVPPHLQTSAEGPAADDSSRKKRHGLLCKPHSAAGTPDPLASGSYCRCLGAAGSTWAQETRIKRCEVAAPPRGWSSTMDSVSRSKAGGGSRTILQVPPGQGPGARPHPAPPGLFPMGRLVSGLLIPSHRLRSCGGKKAEDEKEGK